MASFLSRKNREIEAQIGDVAVSLGTTDYEKSDVYAKYQKALDEKEVLHLKFVSCGRDGTFSAMDDNNVYIVMKGSSTIERLPYFKPRMASTMLGYTFDVRVVEIDKDNRCVYVESSHSGKHATNTTITSELVRALENDKRPVVWGRISNIDRERNLAHVDLLGERVHGVIRVKFWSKYYLRQIGSACKVGEYYSFHVTGMSEPKPDKKITFFLDRRDSALDEWEAIPDGRIRSDDIVVVTCVENPVGRSNWWGTCSLAPGIEVMGLYPNSEKKLDFFPGVSYKCKVRKFHKPSADKNGLGQFVVMPFAVSDEDSIRYARYKTARECAAVTDMDDNSDSSTFVVKE